MTWKQQCELISDFMKVSLGIDRTPEQIWSYSPTGELFWVVALGEMSDGWNELGRPVFTEENRSCVLAMIPKSLGGR